MERLNGSLFRGFTKWIKDKPEKTSDGARGVADRGERRDKNQHQKQDQERRQDESREDGGDGEHGTEGLRARLDQLSTALHAQGEADKSLDAAKLDRDRASPGAIGNAMGLAVRVLSEFVAAVLVGAAIGWWIDRAAGTTPAFLVVFLLMGAAAGFWNVYRIAMKPPDGAG
jgi:ATP synthase protein I